MSVGVSLGINDIDMGSATQNFSILDGAGSLSLSTGSTWTVSAGRTLTISEALNNAGNTLFVIGAGNTTFNSTIEGSGAVNKNGPGTLTLNGSNTYTGQTTVSAGALLVNAVQDNACSGAVTVANGATLSGTGTIKGDITIQDGGIMKPGDGGVGTLTAGNGKNVTFQGASILVVDAAKDLLDVGGDLTLPAGTATIELEPGYSYSEDVQVVLIGSSTNTFSDANLPAGWSSIFTPDTDVKLTYSSPSIPTLNEWGMIIFTMFMAGSAIWIIRRRRIT